MEVSLKAKPARMLELSPKGTVPVVELDDGTVIDLDIMLWTLRRNDPEGWGADDAVLAEMLALIAKNDGDFKHHLDRTKYAVRENADPEFTVMLRSILEGALGTPGGGDLPHGRPADASGLGHLPVYPTVCEHRSRPLRRVQHRPTPEWLDWGWRARASTIMKKGSRWAQ